MHFLKRHALRAISRSDQSADGGGQVPLADFLRYGMVDSPSPTVRGRQSIEVNNVVKVDIALEAFAAPPVGSGAMGAGDLDGLGNIDAGAISPHVSGPDDHAAHARRGKNGTLGLDASGDRVLEIARQLIREMWRRRAEPGSRQRQGCGFIEGGIGALAVGENAENGRAAGEDQRFAATLERRCQRQDRVPVGGERFDVAGAATRAGGDQNDGCAL